MAILDNPKYLLFALSVVFVLTLMGGLLDGVIMAPGQGAWHNLLNGGMMEKIKALGQLWFWSFPWLDGSLELLAWFPFRILNITFTLLVAIGLARLTRELLPIP